MSGKDELLAPFTELLRDIAPSEQIRLAEQGVAPPGLWESIQASGFADALISEERGGYGLSLADVHPLLIACGEQLFPPAFGQTLLARALIASAGQTAPSESIVLWPGSATRELRSMVLPAACEGVLALTQFGSTMEVRRLRAAPACPDGFGMVPATFEDAAPLISFRSPDIDLLDFAAATVAASMTGAMVRMVEMSLAFANERRQFGRSLSAFQAIQHQLSVAGEQVVQSITATRMAFRNLQVVIDPNRAAIAKVIANDAASVVCAVTHAVHGAIGISRDYDLQLYSRRLLRWQVSFGSTDYWARRIGVARLSGNYADSVGFIRAVSGA